MSRDQYLNYENDEFRMSTHGNLAILKLKMNVYKALTNLPETEILFSFLDSVEKEKTFKAIVIINDKGCLGIDAYEGFINDILRKNGKNIDDFNEIIGFCNGVDRAKEINILNRVINRLIQFKKMVIVGLSGDVVTPFLGTALAADYRIASHDVVFELVHKIFGLHPSGGLAYFLRDYLGKAIASEILLTKKSIDLQTAHTLGLVNEIFDKENYEEYCLHRAAEIVDDIPICVVQSTKRLLNYDKKELEYYFDVESEIIVK